MSSQIIELVASVTSKLPKAPKINDRELVHHLLSLNYEYFLLRGTLIDQLTPVGVLLHAEDFPILFDCYEYLEGLLITNQPYQHYTCISDGLLATEAHSGREVVQFQLNYCPKLDKANLVSFTTSLSEAEYVQWWRSIVHQILAIANGEAR
jgi:hypothetical protein